MEPSGEGTEIHPLCRPSRFSWPFLCNSYIVLTASGRDAGMPPAGPTDVEARVTGRSGGDAGLPAARALLTSDLQSVLSIIDESAASLRALLDSAVADVKAAAVSLASDGGVALSAASAECGDEVNERTLYFIVD